jgi:hypothetical protein
MALKRRVLETNDTLIPETAISTSPVSFTVEQRYMLFSILVQVMMYAFFWVIPRRLKFICRRFGTPCLLHLHRQVGVCRIILHILHV